MKPLTIIGMLLFAMLPTAPAADNPFAKPAKELVRPDREILRLPGSVTHKVIDEARHQYTVSGLYMGAASEEEDPEVVSEGYIFLIPDALDLVVDFEARKATFTTSRKLTYSELAYAMDEMAGLGGDFPYWVELEARDLEPTEDYARLGYTVEFVEQPPALRLPGFPALGDEVSRLPLGIGGRELGSLLVVPATSYGMSYSRFSLRVLDPDGKVIWKDEDTAYGTTTIVLSHATEFGIQDIWLIRGAGSETKTFRIRGHLLQEQAHKGEP